MSRFVLLRHEVPKEFGRPSHFDLMFESDFESSLLTWTIDEQPATGRILDAVRLPNHRVTYLDYEGPISNNRGTVHRVDRGDCKVEHLTADCIRVTIKGQILQGSIVLNRINSDQWQLHYHT